MTTPEQSPQGRGLAWLSAIKGLTLTNALVIVILAFVAIPVYMTYRALNDEHLLDRFLSHYKEVSAQQSPCTLRSARIRGGPENWGISTGFAYSGNDRYLLSVILDHQPTNEEIMSYCATLNLIVDYMKDPDPNVESPPFPGTNKPIVRKYRNNGGEQQK